MKKTIVYSLFVVFAFVILGCEKKDKDKELTKAQKCDLVRKEIPRFVQDKYNSSWFSVADNNTGISFASCYNNSVSDLIKCIAKVEKDFCEKVAITSDELSKAYLKAWAYRFAKNEYKEIAERKAPEERSEYDCSEGRGHCPSWNFFWVDQRIERMRDIVKRDTGLNIFKDIVAEDISEDKFREAGKKYQAGYKNKLIDELKKYPSTDLPDSPNELVKMIGIADPNLSKTEKAELAKYASEAYARLAEKILRSLRNWEFEFPETLEYIDTLREYLKDGKLSLSAIGTTDAELKKLERRYPTLK